MHMFSIDIHCTAKEARRVGALNSVSPVLLLLPYNETYGVVKLITTHIAFIKESEQFAFYCIFSGSIIFMNYNFHMKKSEQLIASLLVLVEPIQTGSCGTQTSC